MVSVDQAMEFEGLVADLLKASGFEITDRHLAEWRFDFLAAIEGEQWAVEVKYYRTPRPQIELLTAALKRLLLALESTPDLRAMLVTSSLLPRAYAEELEDRFGVVIAGREELFAWGKAEPALADRLTALLESRAALEYEEVGRGISALRMKELRPSPWREAADTTGTVLCHELRNLETGNSKWRAFESLCERVLRYLFPNDLHGWHKQKRTDDGLNRFDFVCRVRPTTEFWQFLIDHIGSRYVLFEFKNYQRTIKQGQVLTTEKYLLEKALRRTAIICTRSGASDSANAMISGAMREHGKLILVLDDAQICDMLHARERGEDPSDLLFEIADDFLLSLSR